MNTDMIEDKITTSARFKSGSLTIIADRLSL